jgi:hypothetical protein
MIVETLESEVIQELIKEMGYHCKVWPDKDRVILQISNTDFEKHMGCLLKQVQHIIEKHHPKRNKDIYVVIRNADKGIENAIKIWKSF